jgi:rubrerythrin
MADDQNVAQEYDAYAEMVQEQSPYLVCDACGFYPIEPIHGHFYCPSCYHQTRCCEGAPLEE